MLSVFSQAQFLSSSRRADHVYIKITCAIQIRRRKSVFTIAEKLSIVEEAYRVPFELKKLLKGIEYNHLRFVNGKKNWQTYQASTNPSECIDRVEREDVYQHLQAFFEAQRDLERPVSIGSLVREAMRFAPDFLMENSRALRRRVEIFAVRVSLVQRRRTHIAQNTRHSADIMTDFVKCINEHITIIYIQERVLRLKER